MSVLLEVSDLKVYFEVQAGIVQAVDDIQFSLQEGETLGLVGESGCGKSVTARSIIRLIPIPPGIVVSGKIVFRGEDLLTVNEDVIRRIRGNSISMIFQEPMTSLNPVYTIGNQIAEAIKLHQKVGKTEARIKTVSLVEQVGISDPERRIWEYPHQLSGGMRQRAMIAMALSCQPALLIADEPTTALDVTTQAQILELMRSLQKELGTAILLIAHDLAVIAEMADQVAVMYAGKIVEYGDVASLFDTPAHPYTEGLLASIPRPNVAEERLHEIKGVVPILINLPPGCRFEPRCSRKLRVCREHAPSVTEVGQGRWVRCFNPLSSRFDIATSSQRDQIGKRDNHGIRINFTNEAVSHKRELNEDGKKIIEVRDIVKHFPLKKGLFSWNKEFVKAVNGISFNIMRGETLGLVGESGCGKTTAGRMILRLIEPTSGSVFFEGSNIFSLNDRSMRKLCKKMQIIFQDPYGSLNPRMRAHEIVARGLHIHEIGTPKERYERTLHLMETVGLKPEQANRYPHEFSGGERQRIAIARALAVSPMFIVADEPVSALDLSVQAQILNLLMDLKSKYGLTYLFVTHDLSVAEHISDRVGVLYLGKLVEIARKDDFYNEPLHPYSIALLSAIPKTNPKIKPKHIILGGEVPSAINPPTGCYFRTRCDNVGEICKELNPAFREVKDGHWVACHKVK